MTDVGLGLGHDPGRSAALLRERLRANQQGNMQIDLNSRCVQAAIPYTSDMQERAL